MCQASQPGPYQRQRIDDYAKAVQSRSSFTEASARSDGFAKNEVGSNLHAWHDSRISFVFGSTIIQYTEGFGAERLSFRSQCARSVLMKSQLLICLLVSLSPMPSLSTAEHQAQFLILTAISPGSTTYVPERVCPLIKSVTLDQCNKR